MTTKLSPSHNVFRGILSIGAAVYAWEVQNLGPMFWILVGLVAVDMILNVNDLEKQWQKVGTGFLALGGPKLISGLLIGGITSGTSLHLLEALMVLVYIQIDYPQVIGWLKKIPGLTKQEKQTLEKDVEDLKQLVVKMAQNAQASQAQEPIAPDTTNPTNPPSPFQNGGSQG